MFRFFIGVLFVLITTQVTAKEKSVYYKGVIKELDQLNMQTRQFRLFEELGLRIKGITTIHELMPYLDWLKKQSFNKNNDSFRYATLYGIYLSKMSSGDVSKALLLHSLLRLEVDVIRCKNSRETVSKYLQWKKTILIHLKRNKTPIDNNIRNITFKLEDIQQNRQGDEWLCGDTNFAKAIKQGNYITSKEGKVTNIRTIPSSDTVIPASFINKEKWQSMRKAKIEKFSQVYFK